MAVFLIDFVVQIKNSMQRDLESPAKWMAIRCRNSAHRCGPKHISKSKVSKTKGFEPLFDDLMAIPCQQQQQQQDIFRAILINASYYFNLRLDK